MRFLVDENVPLLVAAALRSGGHDCFVVAEGASQASDTDLMAFARAENRVLVTFDSDFARMIFHDLAPPPTGVVFMRSRPEQATAVARSFVDLFMAGRIDPYLALRYPGCWRHRSIDAVGADRPWLNTTTTSS